MWDETPFAAPSTLRTITIVAFSFMTTLLVFLGSQAVQLMNLPFGLIATSLFVFGSAGLAFPAAFNVRPLRFTGLVAEVRWRLVLLAALCGAVNVAFANTMMGALRELLPREWSRMADDITRLLAGADTASRILITIGAGLAAPIGEELFFRGWLQGVMSRRFGHAWAIGITAVLFSITHLDPVGFLPRVELGILFGLMRARSRSILPAIAAHAAHNLISTSVLYLSDDPLAELNEPFDWSLALAFSTPSAIATWFVLGLTRKAGLSPQEGHPPAEPLISGLPTFRLNRSRAITAAAIATAAFATAAGAIFVMRESLPGRELSNAIRPAPATPTK